MKTTFTLFLACMGLLHVHAQSDNPFSGIGKPGKILTLSHGKYIEMHINDSLQRVGSVIVNMKTGKIHQLLNADSLYNDSMIDPTILTRWYSVDPLASRYPGMSPYAFCNNNPVIYRDPDGRSGIVTITQGVDGNPGTIKISMHVVFYGTGATPELAHATQDYINNLVNTSSLKYMVNGQEYNVEMDLSVEAATEAAAFADARGAFSTSLPNEDYSRNYVRIEDFNEEQKQRGDSDPWVAHDYGHKQGYVSEWLGGLGGNSGFIITDDLENDYSALLHELWHGLFSEHTDVTSVITTPATTLPLNTPADKFPNIPDNFTIMNEKGKKVIDVRKRMLTVEDMNILFKKSGYEINSDGNGVLNLKLANNGVTTINIGNLDNSYYEVSGKKNNDRNSIRKNE